MLAVFADVLEIFDLRIGLRLGLRGVCRAQRKPNLLLEPLDILAHQYEAWRAEWTVRLWRADGVVNFPATKAPGQASRAHRCR